MEEESAKWRKHCEDEERRIEEEYQRSLAEIRERFRKASKAIELEFAARKEEVKRQFSDEDLREKSACTTSQPEANNRHPASTVPSNCIVQKRTIDVMNVVRKAAKAQNKGENDQHDWISVWNLPTYKHIEIRGNHRARQSQFGRYISRETNAVSKKQRLFAITVFEVYDPGGILYEQFGRRKNNERQFDSADCGSPVLCCFQIIAIPCEYSNHCSDRLPVSREGDCCGELLVL